MTPEQFCYWLQGFKELHGQTPTSIQWVQIMQHLDTVFKKVTPSFQSYPMLPNYNIPTTLTTTSPEYFKDIPKQTYNEPFGPIIC